MVVRRILFRCGRGWSVIIPFWLMLRVVDRNSTLLCLCGCPMPVKWAFRRSHLKNFSLSSFTVNSSVRVVMGMKLGPFASKALSSSPSGRSSGMVTTSLLVSCALFITTASTVCCAVLERFSMTFTANGKRQKWNFCRLSSALCTVESKYLNLLWIVRDYFLFLCDLFKDYKERIENQR